MATPGELLARKLRGDSSVKMSDVAKASVLYFANHGVDCSVECTSQDARFTPERMKKMLFKKKKLPCCGSKKFLEGPQGGLSMNIKCSKCGECFNVCWHTQFIEKISNS